MAKLAPSDGGDISAATGTTVSDSNIPDDPTAKLGFEIAPTGENAFWSFTPTYYPDRLVQNKPRKLNRDGRQCGGENVSIKKIQNREFHVKGILLASELWEFQQLLDYEGAVDLFSPLCPDGGMRCQIKNPELGKKVGWDPLETEFQFSYSVDLVSTGRDEYDTGTNAIVSEIIGGGSISTTISGDSTPFTP